MDTKYNAVTGTKYPIIQAGMVWTSGWKLASAVSNNGGLGVVGGGSMQANLLNEHLVQLKKSLQKPDLPFAVNLPLLYKHVEDQLRILDENQVPVVITSAGNPKTYTKLLQKNGARVFHVVSSLKFALKAQEAGVDAVIAEGFEAGGHNGREETTTLVLLQELRNQLKIPVIAAGGIGSGAAMAAAFALGASAVQVGSLFVPTEESSVHINYKQALIEAGSGSTELCMKALNPVRLLKNNFYQDIKRLEIKGASPETLKNALGKGRAKLGMLEGNLQDGELEIGQIISTVNTLKPAKQVLEDLMEDYHSVKASVNNWP